MGDKEWAPDNVLDVFGDSIARATLVLAWDQPVAVKEIASELDVSDPTIYRRVDSLVEANLLRARHRVDQNGNQHKEYETVLDEVTFRVDGDGFSIDIETRQDVTDDFRSLWTDLNYSPRDKGSPSRNHPSTDPRREDIS